MSAVTGGGNYISDGQIMTWLAEQQHRIYGDLRESMDLSQDRTKFVDELNDIKAHLHDANASEKHDFRTVSAEIDGFLEKYGADPEFADLCDGLRGMSDKIHRDIDAATAAPSPPTALGQSVQQSGGGPALFGVQNPSGTAAAAGEPPHGGGNSSIPAVQDPSGNAAAANAWAAQKAFSMPGYDDNQMKSWDDLIGGKVDVANRNDQLTMIHIQELKATLDQGSQMASTFISSGDKTSSAIINNIA